jgi:low temperature requirement protein LtrA
VSERRTGSVELFWDLVFVFAVTQVTTFLSHDISWSGFGRAMLLLALMWWAWSAFVWAANVEDEGSLILRSVLLVGMILIFIAGLALPEAFAELSTLFAITYSGVRFMHLLLYAQVSRRGRASWSAIAGFGSTVILGMALLIIGSFFPGVTRVVMWSAAVAIDYAGPAWLTRARLRGLQQLAVAHFAERYSLFVIICLGESIVAIGLSAAGQTIDAKAVVTVAFALLATIGLWWTYFHRSSSVAEERLRNHEDPVLAAADSYSYIHLLIVAGIIVFAVGVKSTVHDPGVPLLDGARLALCGGVALYLLGNWAFQVRMFGSARSEKVVATIASVAIYFVTGDLAAEWVVALLCAMLAAFNAVETSRAGST